MDEVKVEDKNVPQEPVKAEIEKPIEGDKPDQTIKEGDKV